MHSNCPTSCGLCSPKCIDVHDDCNHWMQDNQCNDNPTFMNLHCPVSCGICKSMCKDLHNDCPGWAAQGECQNNPGHTMRNCPYSCSVCAQTTCADKNTTACKIW